MPTPDEILKEKRERLKALREPVTPSQESPTAPVAGTPVAEDVPQSRSATTPIGALVRGSSDSPPPSADAGGILEGIAAGAVRAPAQALGGAFDFAYDIGQGGGYLLKQVDQKYLRSTLSGGAASLNSAVGSSPVGKAFGTIFDSKATGKPAFANTLTQSNSFGKLGNDTANQITTEVGAVVLAFGGLRSAAQKTLGPSLARLSPASRIAGETIILGGGAAQVLDPEAERLGNFLLSVGIDDPAGFVEFLATEEDESRVEARLAMAFEEGATGVLADGVFTGIRAIRKALRGDQAGAEALQKEAQAAMGLTPPELPTVREVAPEDALAASLDNDFALIRATQARAAAVQNPGGPSISSADVDASPPPPSSPSLGAVVDGAGQSGDPLGLTQSPPSPGVNPPRAPREDILKAANAALKASGSSEVLTSVDIRAGKVVVPDTASKLLKDAGASRTFISKSAADQLPPDSDMVFFARGGDDGLEAAPASIAKQSLSEIVATVRAFEDGVVGTKELEKLSGKQNFLAKFNNAEGLQNTMRGAIAAAGPSKKVRNDADRMLRARELADALGTDATTALAWMRTLGDSTGNLDIQMTTAETLWRRSTQSVDDLRVADLAEASDTSLSQVAQSIHNLMVFTDVLNAAKSGLGRALRTRRTLDADTYLSIVGDKEAAREAAEAALRDDSMPAMPYTRQQIIDWVQAFKDTTGAPQARAGMLADYTLPRPLGYLLTSPINAFTSNILTAPYSLLMNFAAPGLVVSPMRTAEKIAGSMSAAIYSTARGDIRGAQEAFARAVDTGTAYQTAAVLFGDMIVNMGKGIIRGDMGDDLASNSFRGIRASASEGQSRLAGSGSASLFDSEQTLRVSPAMREMARQAPNNGSGLSSGGGLGDRASTGMYVLGNMINYLPRHFRKLSAGMDDFAGRISYAGEASVNILQAGRRLGLEGRALHDYLKRELPNTLDERFRATDEASLESAQRSTLTYRPGSEGAGEKMSSAINAIRREMPIARIVLPIFTVAANGVGESLRRIPGLSASFPETQRELLGKAGPRAQEEAMGRMYMGASLLMLGTYLAEHGYITGPAPKDARARTAWEAKGHQPYSMRFDKEGGDWVDYSRYDVAGTILGITAGLYDTTTYTDDAEHQENLVYAALGSFSEYLRDRSAMQTVVDLLSAEKDGPNSIEGLEGRVRQVAASTVVPNFVTALGRNLTDQQSRNPQTVWEAILNKLPLASRTLSPKLNFLGEPLYIPRDTLQENALPVLIKSPKQDGDDIVVDEVYRLYQSVGAVPGVPSTRDLGKGFFDPRTIDLRNEIPGGYDMFNEWLYRRGTIPNDEGLTLRQSLELTIGGPDYAEAVDADASRANTLDAGKSRSKLLSDVFKEYSDLAKQDLAKASPTAARYMAIARIKEGGSGALKQYTTNDIIENPTLLDALGVNLDDYIAEQQGN